MKEECLQILWNETQYLTNNNHAFSLPNLSKTL